MKTGFIVVQLLSLSGITIIILGRVRGKIIGQTPTSNEQFGTSVFLNGKYLAIGTLYEYQNNLYNGSVTLYTKNQNTNTWEFSKIKNGPSSAAGDRFGGSISVSDNYLMVGADYRTENGNLNAGSVTIYKRYENNWIEHESFHALSQRRKVDLDFR